DRTHQGEAETLRHHRRHRPSEPTGALRATDDQVVRRSGSNGPDHPGCAESVRVFQAGVLDMNASRPTHRECLADRVQGLRRPHGEDRYLSPGLLDDLEASFDRVLVTGIEHQVDALAYQPLALRVDLARRIRVRDLLDANEHIHRACSHYPGKGSHQTYVLYWPGGGAPGVLRDRREVGPEPGPAHGLQLVTQPLPGLRSQLRLLLCPSPRQAGRP